MKPYAGRGGMKKLLERRRMEEEEAHHKARQLKLSVIEEADEEGQYEEPHEDEPLPEQEPETDFQPTSIGGREQSSLRVGRKRNNRNHIQRPQMRSKAGGRYAAIFEEEDEDSMVMDEESERERKELEEAAKKAGKGVNVRYQEDYDHSYFFISTFASDHVEHAAKYLTK